MANSRPQQMWSCVKHTLGRHGSVAMGESSVESLEIFGKMLGKWWLMVEKCWKNGGEWWKNGGKMVVNGWNIWNPDENLRTNGGYNWRIIPRSAPENHKDHFFARTFLSIWVWTSFPNTAMSGCNPSTYRSIVFVKSWICRTGSDMFRQYECLV